MRTRFLRLTAVFGSLFLFLQLGSAQTTCKSFHVIVQARLYTGPPLSPLPPAPYQFGWSGPFAGTLDGVPVAGFLTYAEAPSVDFPPPGDVNKGKVGKETNVIFKFEFAGPAPAASFQTVQDWGVFPNAPGQGTGNYTSTATIDPAKGVGAFAGASGFFTIAGPAFAPVFAPPEILQSAIGMWSAEANGKVCLAS